MNNQKKSRFPSESRRTGRKIPVGLNFLLDMIPHAGIPALGLGVAMFILSFALPIFYLFLMSVPFFWSDAGVATITEIEQKQNAEEKPSESIRFVYHDLLGNEYQHHSSTSEKKGNFVVGNQYPILKFRENWQLTTLADLNFWERYPTLWPLLFYYALTFAFFFSGLSLYLVGSWKNRWKRELLRFGTHTVGTFSHNEPILWSRGIFGTKNMFCFSCEGTEFYASFLRRRSKKESPQVDVFYDPLNPERAYVLQSYVNSKNVHYFPESDTFQTSRSLTILAWIVNSAIIAFLAFVLFSIVRAFLL